MCQRECLSHPLLTNWVRPQIQFNQQAWAIAADFTVPLIHTEHDESRQRGRYTVTLIQQTLCTVNAEQGTTAVQQFHWNIVAACKLTEWSNISLTIQF